MRVVAARLRELAWTLDGRGAAAGRSARRGLVLEVVTETGLTGRGEASPLPGMSRDTLEDARAALADFVARTSTHVEPLARFTVAPADIAARGRAVTAIFQVARAFAAAPSARFAIETTLLDALAQTRGSSIARLIDPAAPTTIVTNALVEDADNARRAVAAGIRVLKLKVHDTEVAWRSELAQRISSIVVAAPGVALRLDANRTWPRASVRERLAELADLARRKGMHIEYVEEPCSDAHELLDDPPHPVRPLHATDEPAGLPLPIALDESLGKLTPAQLDRALASPSLAALILKPTLLGGFAECLALAHRARGAGVAAVVTHALESAIGAAACFELARVVGSTRAHGVAAAVSATASDSDSDPISVSEPARRAPEIERARPRPAGHAARVDTSDSTSTSASDSVSTSEPARRAPEIKPGTERLRPEVLVATSAEYTIARLRQALDARRPVALLHPALPDAELARQRATIEDAALDAGDLVLFTSGSTGQARGVVLSRGAIEAAALASVTHLGWRAGDRWLLALSTAHAGGAAVVARCHFAGKPIAVLETWERAGAAALLEQCTLASLVPAQLADLLRDPGWLPPRRLRAVLLGGAAASPALLASAARRGVPFLTTYGMTESFGQLATAALERAGDPAAPLVPLRGVELAAGTRAVPAPIRVRAPMLASRYLDGTPIAPEHETSDLGFVEDGALHVVGRADDMIITGGENVSPAAVEAVLVATPGVRAACAFGIPDERWGQIVGVAIAAERIDRETLAAWHAALPAHARPREVALVRELPLLATGKLDRRAAARLPREHVQY